MLQNHCGENKQSLPTANLKPRVPNCRWLSADATLEFQNYSKHQIMPRSPHGWIPYTLFNAYVQSHADFNQLCLYFNNRASTENTSRKTIFLHQQKYS